MNYHYLLKISYDGKLFHGVVPQPEVKTVLGELFKVIGKPIRFSIVSRTDKGVSARENYVSFSTNRKLNINDIEVEGVKILKAFELKEYLNVRKVAVEKEYHYKLSLNVNKDDWFVFKPKYIILNSNKIKVEQQKSLDHLDLELIRKAMRELVGKHNFQNFAKGTVKNSVCKVTKVDFVVDGDEATFVICGNRFLYEMVRKIVSFLLSVGFGLFPINYVKVVLENAILEPKPPSAPPENLLLYRISLDWIKIYKLIKKVIL